MDGFLILAGLCLIFGLGFVSGTWFGLRELEQHRWHGDGSTDEIYRNRPHERR